MGIKYFSIFLIVLAFSGEVTMAASRYPSTRLGQFQYSRPKQCQQHGRIQVCNAMLKNGSYVVSGRQSPKDWAGLQ